MCVIARRQGWYHRWYTAVFSYLARFLHAQITALLVSLPFLILWGLPLSIMVMMGNLIFAPLLACFLFVSSLLFFSEFFGLPNAFFVDILEWICVSWRTIIECGQKTWLYAIPSWCNYALIFVIPITYILMRFIWPKLSQRMYGLLLISAFSLLGTVLSFVGGQQDNPFLKNLQIREHDSKIILIDNGFFMRKKNITGAIRFEVRPYLLKQFGTTHIDTFELQKPCAASFNAAVEFVKTTPIKRVVLPYFEKELSKYDWFCFFRLKRTLTTHNVAFVRSTTQARPIASSSAQQSL